MTRPGGTVPGSDQLKASVEIGGLNLDRDYRINQHLFTVQRAGRFSVTTGVYHFNSIPAEVPWQPKSEGWVHGAGQRLIRYLLHKEGQPLV